MTPLKFVKRGAIPALALLLGLSQVASGQTNIPVPNGTFENAANDGTIGGGLLQFGQQTAYPLGSGPWSANSTGVLALLLSPVVSIDSNGGGNGTLFFGGLATVNVAGLLSTQANAFTTLGGQSYAANSLYTLTFDFSSASLLSADLLGDLGFGVSLTNGGTASNPGSIAASSSLNPLLLDLGLLAPANSGTATFTFTTGNLAPTGDLGILFSFGEANGLLGVNALSGLTIDNVALSVTPVPEPGSLTLLGLGIYFLVRRRNRR